MISITATIALIETLAVFQSPPIALCSDKMGGIYVASQNEISHFVNDTITEKVSRVDANILSGIGDIEFSGNWLYALFPERRIVMRFDRRLIYVGEIEIEANSQKIALTPEGDFWLYDDFSKRFLKYSSVGDPIEMLRVVGNASSFDNAEMIGMAKWNNFAECPPLKAGAYQRHIAATDIPILWVSTDKIIIPGIEYDAKLELEPAIQQVWLSEGNVIYYSLDDSLRICSRGAFKWAYGDKLPKDIVIRESEIYFIIEKMLIRTKLEWKK